MKKYLIIFGKTIAALPLAVIVAASIGHLFVPVYDFDTPKPFSGEAIHNPYDGVDFGQAKKAILHFHTSLSDGSDEPASVVEAYLDMGYQIVSIADHDRITPAGIDPARELRTYEHGLNIFRFHNVVFGVVKPLFFQLPLWQGVSAREETMRRLSERFEIVVLNHPAGVRALNTGQMERLSHYDYIEADWAMDWDLSMWDAALSAGHYSYVMANDDLHDTARSGALGRAMTFVMTDDARATSVSGALKAGHTYGVRIERPAVTPDSLCIPQVRSFTLAGDTLRVAFSDPARVRFVGQDGVVRREVFGDEACCLFGTDDTYMRVEAHFDTDRTGGASIYLNPVARYSPADGERPINASYSVRNLPLTVLSVTGHMLLIVACGAAIYLLFRKRKSVGVK